MIRLEGFGLHGGAPSSVVLSRGAGPTTIEGCTLDRLDVRGVDRCTEARLPSGRTIRSIEHLLSAIHGCGAFDGLAVSIEGDEVPLLDGASACIASAITEIVPHPSARVAYVLRAISFEVDEARVSFEPHDDTLIEVEVSFDAARFGRPLRGAARWLGDRATYLDSIAPSRTFGAMRELAALRARGLAAHVPEGAVVALDDDAHGPRDPSEPIRHKLLDAIGDLAALGASIRGRVRLERPSHRTTTVALARARAEKLFETRN